MNKKFAFLSGLPRSGSTVLANILMQNPSFHCSATSGLPALFGPTKNGWDNISSHMAMPKDLSRTKQRNVLRSLFDGYYADVDRPFVIDKSRDWPNLIQSLNWVFDDKVKIIATVRDVRQIIESFEDIYIKSSAYMASGGEGVNELPTMEDRADFFISGGHVLGSSYLAIQECIKKGFGEQILFVQYESLYRNPDAVLSGIYEFLGEPNYRHDFDNIEQVIFEDDRVHKFENLHDISSSLHPAVIRNRLGEFGKKFDGNNFWENLT